MRIGQDALLNSAGLRALLKTGSRAICMGFLGAAFGVCSTTPASADLIHPKAIRTFQPLLALSVEDRSIDLTGKFLNWHSDFTTQDFVRSPSSPLGDPNPEPASEVTLNIDALLGIA